MIVLNSGAVMLTWLTHESLCRCRFRSLAAREGRGHQRGWAPASNFPIAAWVWRSRSERGGRDPSVTRPWKAIHGPR